MDVRNAGLTGRIYTDALVYGPAWNGLSLTFGFPTSINQFTGYPTDHPFTGFEAFNSAQQSAVRSILASISTFTNLTFTELAGGAAADAVLRFGMTDDLDDSVIAEAYLPHPSPMGGDSWYLNEGGYNDAPQLGNSAWHTFLHEIGHTLGLAHPHEPGEGRPAMPSWQDLMAYTVMSYEGYATNQWDWAQSYMMEDIAALQFLYGANFDYNNTDTVYRLAPGAACLAPLIDSVPVC